MVFQLYKKMSFCFFCHLAHHLEFRNLRRVGQFLLGLCGGGLYLDLRDLRSVGQFLLGLVNPGHIVKSDRRFIAGKHAGSTLAKAERLVAGSLRLTQNEKEETANEDQRQQRAQQSLW
jgi:hypothetical protein